MTAVQEPPRTVLRSELATAEEQPAAGRPSSGWPELTGRVLIGTALLLAWTVLHLTVLSDFAEARAQAGLYARLRTELAAGTAPVSRPVAVGAPVALLDAPAAGVRRAVVVEGTAAAQLQDGPGHLRSSALPGQSGLTVIMGRSLSYGGVFAHLSRLRPGDVVTVTTGQGRFRYVVRARRFRGGVLEVPVSTPALLTLVSSYGRGAFARVAPSDTLYVDAVLAGTPQLPAGTPATPDAAELPMHGDHSFGTLAALVLCLQLFVAVLAAVVWARARWSPVAVHVLATPVVVAALWLVSDVATRLLPNLM